MSQSRNSPCACGSGRKFKFCHGKANIQPKTANLVEAVKRPEIEGPALAILLPTRGTITIETAQALGAHLDNFPHLLNSVNRQSAEKARNRLAKCVQELPVTAPVTCKSGWICAWVDSDAYWRAGTIKRMVKNLLEHPEIDVLCGWFSGRSPRSNPVCYREDWTWPVPGKDCEQGDIVEIARCGFHFVMHRAELLDRLPENPFTVTDKSIKDGSGEDLAFCDNVRKAGGRIWVDTGAFVAHVADDGMAYLPMENAMTVVGGNLRRVEGVVSREYQLQKRKEARKGPTDEQAVTA